MKIGIIGGSGLDDPKFLQDYEEKEVSTPYGQPSSPLTCGKISGVEVCILARHGKKHHIPPTHINNRANIHALKDEGCTHIIATTAVGSLREHIGRGDFVILSDFIDFTRHRHTTFYQNFKNGLKHTPMTDPFDFDLRNKVVDACQKLKLKFHKRGTVITIEGPRFSTRAESHMFQSWGADVINMSTAPEAALAKEAQIPYVAIAMSTDYDVWKVDETPVTWEQVLEIFQKNADKMKSLVQQTISNLSTTDINYIKSKIKTTPNWPKPGIIFRDVSTMLRDTRAFSKAIDLLVKRYADKKIDVIAGIDSRGFIVGSALSLRLDRPFVLVRKPGKLPPDTIREEYNLEYGKDAVEIHRDAISPGDNVLLVDDLIATGGTVAAAGNLIERLGGNVVECAFIVELPDLKGRLKVRWPVFSLVSFEGE